MSVDWRTVPEGRRKYYAYLGSSQWTLKRLVVLSRANGACQRCLLPASHVHHKTYTRLYREKPQDLMAVCASCHSFLHGKLGSDRGACEKVAACLVPVLGDIRGRMAVATLEFVGPDRRLEGVKVQRVGAVE